MATAYVYTPLGWVSGSGPKINGADLSTMDNGIRQGAHITGLESDRTAALATANPGVLFWATDSNLLYQSLGASTWTQIATPAPFVTSLPASPADGSECVYLADATNGIAWRLKYRAAEAGSYKWYYVGGQPLLNEVVTDQSVTGNTNYNDLGGPTVTTPLAGDYTVEQGAWSYNTGTASNILMAFAVGATAAADADALFAAPNTGAGFQGTRARKVTGVAASTAITSKYKVSNTATVGHWVYREMRVTPIRVG